MLRAAELKEFNLEQQKVKRAEKGRELSQKRITGYTRTGRKTSTSVNGPTFIVISPCSHILASHAEQVETEGIGACNNIFVRQDFKEAQVISKVYLSAVPPLDFVAPEGSNSNPEAAEIDKFLRNRENSYTDFTKHAARASSRLSGTKRTEPRAPRGRPPRRDSSSVTSLEHRHQEGHRIEREHCREHQRHQQRQQGDCTSRRDGQIGRAHV